jgi:hypothetical protein
MNTSIQKKSLAFFVNQGVAVVTAGAFLFTSLGANAAEATFWEERAAASARRQASPSAGQTLLARLPFNPVSAVPPLSRAAAPLSVSLGEKAGSSWLRETVSPFADVRSARDEFNGDLKVWLVMDAHDVYSAQRNLSRLLAQVGARHKTVVGVEGSVGGFQLDSYRGLLPEPQFADLVDHLLKKGFINGPEAYGLLNPSARLWGVEDPALYDANVQAYRDSLSLETQAKNVLDTLKKDSARKSKELFSQDLRALDEQALALHEDRVNLSQYAQVVWASAGQAGAPSSKTAFKNVALFIGANAKEKALSFPQVEQARAAFIERLSPRLSPYELDALVKDTTDFRAGRVGAHVYYRALEALARSKGVPLSAYPAFQEYVSYVVEAEQIDAAALFEELDELEDRAFARLAVGEAGVLAQWNRDLRLVERAVEHALTPREWARYQERAPSLAQLEARARDLGIASAPAAELSGLLPRFAAFFEKAQARNASLLDNVLEEARRQHADCAVLVTGGFHAPALERALTEAKISHVVLSPRMAEVPESAASYLQAFAPTRTPLERLLLGDRLYMNPPSATSAAVQKNGHEFHGSAVALNRAVLTYGSVMAAPSPRPSPASGRGSRAIPLAIEDLVSRWNERFSQSGQAVARQSQHRGVQLAEVQFDGAGQSVFLATPVEGTVASGDSLAQAVNKKGAEVVETDRVGNVSYVLGGKSVTRIVPELLSGAAFLLWLGASSLAPPSWVAAVGFLTFVVVGGMSVRGLFVVSTYWHGLGHALAARVFAKKPVRDSLTDYSKKMSWGQLVPFSSFFLPGVTGAEEAPHFTVDSLNGWKLRLAALAGPLMSLAVVVSLVPFLPTTGPVSLSGLVLWAAAGINLWAGLSSGSDWRTVLSGVGRSFFCGVIGVVYGGPNPKAEMMPTGVQHLMDEGVESTVHRGGQSGGVLAVGVKENGHAEFRFFVEKRAKESNRRARLGELMRDATFQLARRAEKAGFGALRRLLVLGHTRYGSNLAQPVALNAHPHLGTDAADTIIYIGEKVRVDHYERPWDRPRGVSAVKFIPMTRGVAIAHNGDDNATVLYRYGESEVVLDNNQDALLNEHMTGFKNPAKGDSPQIATRLERWITQGSVAASLRLTLLMVAMESLRGQETSFDKILTRAPTPELMETFLQAQVLQSFPEDVKRLHGAHPEAGLEDLFRSAGALIGSPETVWDLEKAIPFETGSDMEKQRTSLSGQAHAILRSSPWFMDLSENEQDRLAGLFADLFLKYFYTGDFRRAGIHLLRRADSTSTYGVMAGTLLEAEGALWLRQNQPFYLWVSEDGKSVAGSSEAKAFLGGKSGESHFRYRLTLRNGEVATLRGSTLVIDHAHDGRVATFDLSDMGKIIAEPRWLDLEASPYVSPSASLKIAPENRVREDLEMIPWVNQKLKEDFADPHSNNSVTGRDFVDRLIQRLSKRRSGQKSGELDLVIVGTEKSYDAAVLHAKALEKISSLAGKRLNIKVIYGAEFTSEDLVALRDAGFGPDTPVLGLVSSGQTANSMYALEALGAAWRGLRDASGDAKAETSPPHFLVSADMDNPYTEEVLGQGLAAGDPFKARNFVTFPTLDSFHPAEAATVTHKATERLLKEVTALFANTLAQRSGRWKNGGLAKPVPAAIRHMVDNGDELDRRITGLDEDGNPHRVLRRSGEQNDIPDQINAVAERMIRAFLETLWGTAATALFISLTLLFHATPATLLLGWFPNQAFLFSGGLPVLAAVVGLGVLGGAAWKTRLWRWHPLLQILGAVVFASAGLFAGESLVLGLDSLGAVWGKEALGSRWGFLPVLVDASPVNLFNVATYVFFFFGFTLGLRKWQGRPLWDRLGGRTLVLADYQHSVARLSAARWRRLLSHRFGWMGLTSINESSLGRLTHEEALNSNVRGNLFLQGEARHAEGPTLMNYKQLGGSPNGPGRIWRMGIGHKPMGEASVAYSEGYISLAMKGDNPAGEDSDLGVIQELLQDAPARDTAGMVLSLAVAEKMSSIKPLNFVPGMTSSEAKTSTTQQPFPPLSQEEVRKIFGLALVPAGNQSAPRPRDSQPLVPVTPTVASMIPLRDEESSVGPAGSVPALTGNAGAAAQVVPTAEASENISIETKAQSRALVPNEADWSSLLSLAEYMGVLVSPEETALEVAEHIQVALQFSGTVNLPAEKVPAFYRALELTRATFVSVDNYSTVEDRASATYPSSLPGSLRVHWNGYEFSVYTTPPRAEATKENTTESVVADAPGLGRGARIYPWVVRFVQKTVKVTAVALALVLITSFGGSVLSLLDRGLAAVFDVPAATQSREARPLSNAQAQNSLLASASSIAPLNPVSVPVVSQVGTTAPLKTYLWVRDQKTGKVRLKTGEIPAGSEFTFLRYNKNKTLVRVKPENARAVWVKANDYKAATQSGNAPRSQPQPLSESSTAVAAGPLASLLLLMGPAGPALAGLNRRHREAAATQPGALLRRRLLAGAKKTFSESDRGVAQALVNEIDNPSDSSWDVRSVRLALGYGALGASAWGSDRGLADDFRRTRAIVKGESLSRAEGRALSTLARAASGWQRLNPADAIDEGALPVLYLAGAESDSQLFRIWNAALLRHRAGAQPPVLVARSADQFLALPRSSKRGRASFLLESIVSFHIESEPL